MKKRALSLAMAAIMTLSLAACGGSSTSTTTAAAAAETTAAGGSGETQPAETVSTDAGEKDNVATTGTDLAALARSETTNPNAGQGLYPGTAKKGSITAEVTTMTQMNTILMTYNNEFSIARHGWDCLVKLNAKNEIVPAAAESWEKSDDGMKWTFHLRKGAKWVDSTGKEIGEVKASDFVFAWSELLNPDNAAEYYAFATIFKNAQKYYDYKSGASTEEVKLEDVGMKAVDDYTLEIELENYLPYLLQYLKFEVMSPICQSFYEQVGADKYGTSPENLAFNGPFYMTEWVTENRVTMAKNPTWWDADNVEVEELNFVKYSDTNTKYNAFLGGELDMMDVTGEQRATFESEGYKVTSYIGGYSYFAWVNNTDASDFRSANLRHAVSEALDRQQLIDTVFKNENEVPKCLTLGISGVKTETFADAVVAANGGEKLYPDHADPAKAKEYLDAALKDLGYTDPSQINITLMTSEGTQNELLSQVMQEQIRQNLGVEIKIEVLTITEWRARRNALQFDFCMGGWGPDYNDPLTDLELLESTNGNNHTGYSNADYDALIASTKEEKDAEKREQIFIDCEKKIQEDMPVIPVYWRHEDYVASEKLLGGFVRKPFQAYYFTYTDLAD
ncbi:MAG: peptide ABC transporter substrate-binding protein [Oribacterium sp.]|jgi:oligopeptide transport system substrate-binding protein|nr:peptide ABC transporter substrate-binding protein [Oribacterium sp.]